MSKCNISIEIGTVKNRGELIKRAKAAIEKHGGSLEGDESKGTFDLHVVIGRIKGNYTVDDNTFTLDVTQKPLLISCKRIETEITKYLV